MLELRPGAEPDHDATRRVHEHAFAPNSEEARLVDPLAYYPRFGFQRGAASGVVDRFGVPSEAWMVHLLPAYTPEARGCVSHAEALSLGG
jgi:predicted N-acetyltransferase YhbS